MDFNTAINFDDEVDVDISREIYDILLHDHSSCRNLIWATDNYKKYGKPYSYKSEITIEQITNKNSEIIRPRLSKTKEEQLIRSREKAEIFTPSWICNAQNNLIDNAWFESQNVFNTEIGQKWITNTKKVCFPRKKGKTWQDYVKQIRLEITCGEAPYLTSRYDTVTGIYIVSKDRIGLLDRKLRVIGEQVSQENEWIKWATVATQSIYGYDWQGDNVFLARKNVLATIIDFYMAKYKKPLSTELQANFAKIIAWNIWQMDGLKYVIPGSCKKIPTSQLSLFDVMQKEEECKGCRTNNPHHHNGIYCKIMDWQANKQIRFIDLLGGKLDEQL